MKNSHILIIKLGAEGDVLRTTPLLYGLREKYPGAEITWLTAKESTPLLKNNPFINRILVDTIRLGNSYDLLINLDKDVRALRTATRLGPGKKLGFGIKNGKIYALNDESDYALRVGIDDELKFKKNKKTYQEIIFEQCSLKYKKQEYLLELSPKQREFSRKFAAKHNLPSSVRKIGLNTGCGPKYPKKKWTIDGFVQLARRLTGEGAKVLLLGGPREIRRNQEIIRNLNSGIIDTGGNNSLEDFVSIVNCCDLVVSGDTVAMHIAIALKKKVIALFGPTCPEEIDLYNRGVKIISPIPCSPCYKKICKKKPTCMDLIPIGQVWDGIKQL